MNYSDRQEPFLTVLFCREAQAGVPAVRAGHGNYWDIIPPIGSKIPLPWVRSCKGWFFGYVTFTVGHELAIPLRIRTKSSGGGCRARMKIGWPVEET